MGLRRREFLRTAALALLAPPPARAGGPELRDLRISSSGPPFAGDGPLLATVSPGRRHRAIVSFRLARPARITIEAVRTDTVRVGRPAGEVVWAREHSFAAGPQRVTWIPGPDVQPRTYILRLTVADRSGRRRAYAPVVRVQGVEVATARRSYAPGEPTDLLVGADAGLLRVQVFHYGGNSPAVARDLKTNGLPVTPAVTVDWSAHRDGPSRLRLLRAGDWESGLYFVRASTEDGRVGYAPFILRPHRLGRERVAVVLATNTWQAYNFHDADGDGWGDSWYVRDAIRSVDLTRPYLDFGVPFRFRDWDLTFIAWANRTGKRVDYLSDDDLESVGSGERLRAAYDLVVFPGHEEYVTTRMYDVVERYRDLGGNLLFLSANNFFWRVRREGRRLVKDRLWRELGRPEAALVGVQYVGSDNGQRQGSYVVAADAETWLFAGTGLAGGASFGRYGIEIDARAAASPPQTRVVARIADLMGPGRSAEMSYYETTAGARVFAAGVLNFAASVDAPEVSRLVDNVWARLARP